MSNTKKTPALAHYAAKEVTPVIAAYAAWLEEQTGYKVDPLSVYLASALRGTFQKSDGNQKRIADRAAELEAETKAKAARRLAAAEAAYAKATAPKPEPKTKAVPKETLVRAAAAKPATLKATPATATEPVQA
ncbi:hypothetical protein [Cryobacterium arcticum]|uniref:Uncharacterized protein n=1 Tax=Cryobacterium arcticum TaxID=670052 RepID=A0A317ZRR2_9MICO|nr:hypothetical protein [Cryobacterium arcticum]PXA68528.1 hypothetical protein CTB96_18225 [Cryobacterium arcticum]